MRRLALCFSICTACTTGHPADGGLDHFDAARPDAGQDGGPLDAGPPDAGQDAHVDHCSLDCGPDELCDPMGGGDGLDNDCDGQVDEVCTCVPGTARSCFPGRPDRRNVGSCADGVEVCDEFAMYGDCSGGQFPIAEVCDGADNDCNGATDDGLTDCASAILCPGSERATPLHEHDLNGSAIYSGEVMSWMWTITCPDSVPSCPLPDDPTARDTTILLLSSGNYRARVDIVLADGSHDTCEWVIYVRGDGLRVELTWDTQGIGHGNTDVDLHLHRRSVPAGTLSGETDFFTPDDCFYLDCKASTYDYDDSAMRLRWALPDTADLSLCEDSPEGEGGTWTALRMACYNPRLDVDVIGCDPAITDPRDAAFCAPENINIDDPPVGDPYRIWVNYYSQHEYIGETHPNVNIYCYGDLRASLGLDPALITLRNGDPTTNARLHDNYVAADVVFFIDECGRPECRVNPIGDVRHDALFVPDWSF